MQQQGNPNHTGSPSLDEPSEWNRDWLPRKWVLRLFALFSNTYQTKFIIGQASPTQQETWFRDWAAGLAGYTGDEIKSALDKMPTHFQEWPPTLFEFMNLARPDIPRPEHRQVLPAPRDTKDRTEEIVSLTQGIGVSEHTQSLTFYDRPGSAIACEWVARIAKEPGSAQERFQRHLEAAIVGGYMTSEGKWTGKR